jgi:hypothetical protein
MTVHIYAVYRSSHSKSLLPHFGLQNCRSQAEASIKHKVLCRSFAKGMSDKDQNIERLAFVCNLSLLQI